MLTSVGLGRRLPVPSNSPSSSTTTTPSHYSVNHCSSKDKLFSSLSTSTMPSPITKTCRQRINLSPLTVDTDANTNAINVNYRTRPYSSPVRPNSLVLSLSKIDSQLDAINPSLPTSVDNSLDVDDHSSIDDDTDKYYSAQSSNLSTPSMQSNSLSAYLKAYEQSLILSSIPDLTTNEQTPTPSKHIGPKNT
jgi:hypothetical protein